MEEEEVGMVEEDGGGWRKRRGGGKEQKGDEEEGEEEEEEKNSASPWPTLELEWGRKLYPSSVPRGAGGMMFGLPPTGADMNQPRGPMTSLKEEPLGARAWMQPAVDQAK
uniref:Uncharacterized protein n=1 Tax=Anopheles culicifacies TaxID=139723 RepID=A0A182MX35_9DIPT